MTPKTARALLAEIEQENRLLRPMANSPGWFTQDAWAANLGPNFPLPHYVLTSRPAASTVTLPWAHTVAVVEQPAYRIPWECKQGKLSYGQVVYRLPDGELVAINALYAELLAGLELRSGLCPTIGMPAIYGFVGRECVVLVMALREFEEPIAAGGKVLQ